MWRHGVVNVLRMKMFIQYWHTTLAMGTVIQLQQCQRHSHHCHFELTLISHRFGIVYSVYFGYEIKRKKFFDIQIKCIGFVQY